MHIPERGERLTLRWPDGLHDFVIKFVRVVEGWSPLGDEWIYLRGEVLEPDPHEQRGLSPKLPFRDFRTFYARPATEPGADFELLPMLLKPRAKP